MSPDVLSRLGAWLASALAASAGDQRWAMAATLALVAGLALLLAAVPWLYLDDMVYDLFIPLDGAWRMANGQLPHLDFYTPVGGLYYALLAAATALFGFGPRVVSQEAALMGLVAGGLAVFVTAGRMPALVRVPAVLFVALLALSPRSLDAATRISHLAGYNRQGWALACVVLLAVMLEPDGRSAWRGRAETVVVAVTLLALFFLKVNYWGLAGAGTLAVALAGGPNRRLALAAGTLSLAGLAMALAGGELARAYVGDLLRAGRAQAGGGDGARLERLPELLGAAMPWLLAIIGLAVAALRTAHDDPERKVAERAALVTLAVLAAILVAALQNHDHALPALLAPALLVLSVLRRRAPVLGPLAGLLVAALALPPLWWDGVAVLRHAWVPLRGQVVAVLPAEARLSGLLAPRATTDPDAKLRMLAGKGALDLYLALPQPSWAEDAHAILADGLALLARVAPARARVASLTFSPLFPVLSGGPPPRHLPAWIDWNRTVGPAAPLGSQAFSDTDVVMVPVALAVPELWPLVEAQIRAEFRLAGETPLWRAWVRR